MSAHTPGPWAFSLMDGSLFVHQAEGAAYTPESSDVGVIRLHTVDSRAIQRANARLIAAAPELLEAMKSILFFIEEGGIGLEFTCERVARAAIAKATQP